MSSVASTPNDRDARRDLLRRLGGSLGPLVALVSVILGFGIADMIHNHTSVSDVWAGNGTFLSIVNARNISVQASTVAVAALGMTMVIIAGGIDLSAGTAIALCATVLAWCFKTEHSAGLAVAACVVTGVACGAINGVLISLLRIVPFIVTLGTMTIYLGIAKWVADDTTVRPNMAQVPDWLRALVSVRNENLTLGLPMGVWLALLLAALLSLVLRYTVFGRHVFALGSNEATARLCGINVPALKIFVYSLSGLFVGMAGLYQFARLSVGNPTSGSGLELKVIAAVVIGGGSLSGGQGTVLGTLTGALIMAVIASGCNALQFQNSAQDIINGLIIVGAVTLDQIRQRRLAG